MSVLRDNLRSASVLAAVSARAAGRPIRNDDDDATDADCEGEVSLVFIRARGRGDHLIFFDRNPFTVRPFKNETVGTNIALSSVPTRFRNK